MATRTVEDLYNTLLELMENGHGDRELRVAYQPNYPLQAHFDGVSVPDNWQWDDEQRDMDTGEPDPAEVEKRKKMPIYLVVGNQDNEKPYAPSLVFDSENQC